MEEEATYRITYNDLSNLTSLQTLSSLKASTISHTKSWSFVETNLEEDLDESNISNDDMDEGYYLKSISSFEKHYLGMSMWPQSSMEFCSSIREKFKKQRKKYECLKQQLDCVKLELRQTERELGLSKENLIRKGDEREKLKENLNEALDLIGVLVLKMNQLLPYSNDIMPTPKFQLSPRNDKEEISFMRY
ncbi:unnamed protein product [Blepharisma stoltei]|uniref:Uncharacterized protein n=1 Tax=Blepharisma stoltei TaxID=1481888 RepID=A0AAU9JFU2_9CILI|nr:unnamed protein product [Blepharisma stoltei]